MHFLIQGPFLEHEDSKYISDYRSNNSWNLSRLPFNLPDQITKQIMATHFPIYTNTYDRIKWGLANTGRFTVQSYNNMAMENMDTTHQLGYFSCIWKLNIRPKLKQFLWLLTLNRLPSASCLHHISYLQSPDCKLCDQHVPETLLHLFVSCPPLHSFGKN